MSEILRISYHLEGISRLVYVRKLCIKHEYVISITTLKNKKQYSLGFTFWSISLTAVAVKLFDLKKA